VIQEKRADRWARWLLTVAGAIAVTAPVALSGQVVAPGGDLARGDGRDPVVAEPGGEPAGEPLQMPGDLPGHLIRPYAPNRQVEVALRPDGETVIGLAEALVEVDYLS
jgi:hypothetical protein